ncbi:MAG: HAD-IIIA family hydrolase [Candidatus Thermoplasmatota archaeon]
MEPIGGPSLTHPAVFLDRDGVLNKRRFPVLRKPKDLVMLSDAADAAARLSQAGFVLCIVTNQEFVGRGYLAYADHMELMRLVTTAIENAGGKVAGAYAALDPSNAKPRPDMILQAAREHDIDLARSYMVGDNAKDMLAGTRAGCTNVLVDPRFRTWLQSAHKHAAHVARDLPAAAEWILTRPQAISDHNK